MGCGSSNLDGTSVTIADHPPESTQNNNENKAQNQNNKDSPIKKKTEKNAASKLSQQTEENLHKSKINSQNLPPPLPGIFHNMILCKATA